MNEEKIRHQKAIALIICMFLGFMYLETIWKPYFYGKPVYNQASNAELQPTNSQPLNNQLVNTQEVDARQTNSELPSNNLVANQAQTNSSPLDSDLKNKIKVLTNDLNVEISLLGGRITKAEVSNYKKDLEKNTPLDLVTHQQGAKYPLGVKVGNLDDAWVNYEVLAPTSLRQNSTIDLRKLEQTTVFLKGTLKDGSVIKKKITFQPEGYIFKVEIQTDKNKPISTYWTRFVEEEKSSRLDPYNSEGFVWQEDTKTQRSSFGDLESVKDLGKTNWLAIGDKYFTAALISPANSIIRNDNKNYFAEISNGTNNINLEIFAGPKSYNLLKKIGYDLHTNLDFGFFGIVSAPLLSLLHFFNSVFRNYGLAIVALTILVRLAMYPLNSASFKQMKAMQEIKPEMDRIKEKIKDKQQQQVAMMELYKKKGVNPLGGCLPMVLQMPIFIGLYAALYLSVELRHAHFGAWINDLSAPEKLMITGSFGIPVLVILFVISMILQQWSTPTAMDPAQKKMMYIMPVVMGFMFASFPAGLTLYWLTSNLITVGQHKALHYSHDKGVSAFKITAAVSVVVFLIAFVVTLF